MHQLKIMFTSVGRRIELMQAYHSAALELGVDLQIWGADITYTAPALAFCDRVVKVCRISDENYIPQLLDICKKNKIDALIPTIDTDLLLLSQNKDKFEKIGTKAIISSYDKIKLCRDKRWTADYFNSVGLKSPHPCDNVNDYVGGFPAFIKPKDGSSSINAYKVYNQKELDAYSEQVPDYIIQPFIEGREYTIDIFCDFEGNPVYITPRERIAVRAGEVLKTEIIDSEKMVQEMNQLIDDYKPCGAITVQLIQDKNTGDNYYIEINPRYGGGAPLSIKAGANSPLAMLKLLLGEKLSYQRKAACINSVYSRFDQSVCTHQGKSNIKAVIFDLDDTLYNEIDYVKSGYKAIANAFPMHVGLYDRLLSAFENGLPAIDTALREIGIYEDKLKADCLDIYRSHMPNISLDEKTTSLLKVLKDKSIQVGIITDGRPIGQQNKIKALGLDKYVSKIVITDELGGVQFRKPCDISFRIMAQYFKLPFESMVYVGDNLNKDFIAPKQLGMHTVFYNNKNGLYEATNVLNADYEINQLNDLMQVLGC